jgi:hypothetical protein
MSQILRRQTVPEKEPVFIYQERPGTSSRYAAVPASLDHTQSSVFATGCSLGVLFHICLEPLALQPGVRKAGKKRTQKCRRSGGGQRRRADPGRAALPPPAMSRPGSRSSGLRGSRTDTRAPRCAGGGNIGLHCRNSSRSSGRSTTRARRKRRKGARKKSRRGSMCGGRTLAGWRRCARASACATSLGFLRRTLTPERSYGTPRRPCSSTSRKCWAKETFKHICGPETSIKHHRSVLPLPPLRNELSPPFCGV